MSAQERLFDISPEVTAEDRREMVKRITAKLEGRRPRRRWKNKCMNCCYLWWQDKPEIEACPRCQSVRVSGLVE